VYAVFFLDTQTLNAWYLYLYDLCKFFSSKILKGGIKTFEPALDHPVTQDQIVRFGGQTDTWRFLEFLSLRFWGDVICLGCFGEGKNPETSIAWLFSGCAPPTNRFKLTPRLEGVSSDS